MIVVGCPGSKRPGRASDPKTSSLAFAFEAFVFRDVIFVFLPVFFLISAAGLVDVPGGVLDVDSFLSGTCKLKSRDWVSAQMSAADSGAFETPGTAAAALAWERVA